MSQERVALVTGAGGGIGRAIASRLSRDGYAIAVVDIDESRSAETVQLITDSGGRAASGIIDVADEQSVTDGVAKLAADLGPPTVLINNAGITRDNLLFRMSVDDWTSVMDVHLKGAFLMTRAVQSFMVDAEWGRIVSLSSLSALGQRGQTNYAAVKAGLQGFTRALAAELGRFGVTANAIAPGFIETEMTMRTAERLKLSYEDYKRSAAEMIPVGRVGTPDDVASLASYLAGAESSFLTGQIIYLTGGPAV